jgi:hypothetical protein
VISNDGLTNLASLAHVCCQDPAVHLLPPFVFFLDPGSIRGAIRSAHHGPGGGGERRGTRPIAASIRVWTGPGFSMFRTEEGEPGWRGVLLVTPPCARQPRPSGQADRHRASQVSRTYSLSMQLVRCACESRSVLIPGDVTVMRPRRQGQKTERFSDDGRHACRWWWCRKRTRTYDWGMDGTAES